MSNSLSSDLLNIVWFRQDLRVSDNPALISAAQRGRVLPIYILDDENAGVDKMGSASRVWLHHSLNLLNQSLEGQLKVFRGNAIDIITQLTSEFDIDYVTWNRCYEPWRIKRDVTVKSHLKLKGIECRSFNASLLWEPWTILKKDDLPYKVFTPFYKNGCLGITPRAAQPMPEDVHYYTDNIASAINITDLSLIPTENWHNTVINHWKVGEHAAKEKLEAFITQTLCDYQSGRDFPALNATSSLSPHLHFGEISPHQIWQRLEFESIHHYFEDLSHFKRELGWREFSYYQLYHWPNLPTEEFNRHYENFKWQRDDSSLQDWQRGNTGIPIIDAGLRELWQTGTMHNRVRMLVASFLVKNLLIDWRKGAQWFWDCLFDADLASNSASWQWCAGCGADAAPYFRIFNPVLQSEKFDPEGQYLLRYCPELAHLPTKFRHKPWLADDAVLTKAGITLGINYPFPIVDLKVTRQRALDRFKQHRIDGSDSQNPQ
jgi:deoxyribodipyrimidine photo-lyase